MSDAQREERRDMPGGVLPNPNPAGQELSPEMSVPIDAASLARHYEQDDVNVGGIVRFGIFILIGGTIAVALLWVVMRFWAGYPLPFQLQLSPARVTPPAVRGPGLDAVPEVTLNNMLEFENERLNSYGWIDRDAGVIHIPIDEAMRLMVERGVPARDGDAPTFRLERAFQLDSSGGTMLEPGGAAETGGEDAESESNGGEGNE